MSVTGDTPLKRARTSPARSYMSSSASTVCDRPLSSPVAEHDEKKAALQVADETGVEPTIIGAVEPTAKPQYSRGRRWFLLLVFCLASAGLAFIKFLDISCRSGVVLFTQQISKDLGIVYESSTWIITSFSVPFACFLLFWGRVADLFSPRTVFLGGFSALGVSCAIVSVCPEMLSFFIFRGLCGLFCSATIPAAFRLIMMVFDGSERATAITVFSLSGAVANAAGLILAAFFGFIHEGGQMQGWRWYFRFIALLSVPFSVIAYRFIPISDSELDYSVAEKWKRFDLPGCAIMLSATLLFILGLTLGATYGWKTPHFLVPFLLCWPVGLCFLFWEKHQKEGYALVPPSTWRIRNVTLLLFISISAFAYWPSTQLPLVERWLTVNGEPPIIVAVRLIPQGVASVIPIFVLPRVPEKWKASRWFIVVTYSIIASMLLPLIYSHGELYNGAYWRYYFPSFVIASFFGAAAFSGISVSFMISVPDEMSGVAGALLQVFLQLGGATVFSIQAGLLTIHPGSFENFTNIQISWWFFGGWYIGNALLVAVLFRDPVKPVKSRQGDGNEEEAQNRIEDGEEADQVTEPIRQTGEPDRPRIMRVQSLV